MGSRTDIEWTRGADGAKGATWNPIRARNLETGAVGWHCEKPSPGCKNCYAETMNIRLGTGLAFRPKHRADGDIEIFLDAKLLGLPLSWRRPRIVFFASMSDIAAEFVSDAMLDEILAIVLLAPKHTFMALTKRPERLAAYLAEPATQARVIAAAAALQGRKKGADDRLSNQRDMTWPLTNLWIGTSIENAREAETRLPALRDIPANVRFVSAEPLLGLIADASLFKGIDLIIAGGESGAKARPVHPAWVAALRDISLSQGIAFFFKQWGMYAPHKPENDEGEARKHIFLDGTVVWRHPSKASAGHLLEGRSWTAMPQQRLAS